MGINNAHKHRIFSYLLLLPLWLILKLGQYIRKPFSAVFWGKFVSFLGNFLYHLGLFAFKTGYFIKGLLRKILKLKDSQPIFIAQRETSLRRLIAQQKATASRLIVKHKPTALRIINQKALIWTALNMVKTALIKAFYAVKLSYPEIKKILTKPVLITKSFFKSVRLPKFKLTKKKVPKRHSHPGRPRSRPLFTYLLKYKYLNFFLFLKKIFPSPLRIALIFSVLLIVFFFYSFFLIVIARDLPSPTRLSDNNGPLTTTFYDRNGEVLYRLYDDKNRSLVKLEELPSDLVQATIAIEDQNFYKHNGVDLRGVARALYTYFHDHEMQGGSTITQQLIKNTLLTPERTLTRKVREVVLAFWTERVFTKKQILQMYFNEVPYGGPAWGIGAAAQTYFNKTPKDLTLAESAYLAGLPASPTTYSPYGANPELGKSRQKEVLKRMVDDGYVTQDQANKAYEQPLTINPPISQIKAPHFVMYVRQMLAEKYGDKVVSQGGLKVYTSLDLKLQNQVEEIVAAEVEKLAPLDVSNGAAMVTDPKNGQILAMVGSKNYWDLDGGNFNVATAPRQPGSSIKPVTYATAFKMGYSPGTILLDSPVSFKNAWETYSPVNYDGRYHGPVTVRTALGSSYNIPAVKMLAIVGIPSMIQTAKDLGITTFNDPNRYGLSLTLGGGEVKLIDMMSVYGSLSQNGMKVEPQPIVKVVDSTGEVLEDDNIPQAKKVLEGGVAYLITNILSDNSARTPAFGPNSLLVIPNHTVAVKTGTTDNKRDNWTFGYTPDYVVGVWVGNNNNKPMNPALTSGVTGAAPIWNNIMHKLLDGKPNIAFNRPAEVVEGIVDGKRDLIINGLQAKSVVGVQKKPQTDKPKKTPEKDAITFTDPFSSITVDGQIAQ